MMNARHRAGFTLIELLVTIAIVALLAAVAVPSYRNYVLRAGRTDALTALNTLAGMQERFRIDHNRYALSLDELAPPYTVNGTGASAWAMSDGARYSLHMTVATPHTFLLEARNYGNQANDSECNFFRLAHTGAQSVGVGTPATCWR